MPLADDFRQSLTELQPLTVGTQPRELIVCAANPEWAALFDCGYPPDRRSTIGHMTRTLGVEGVVVGAIPDVEGSFPSADFSGSSQLRV